MQHEMLLLKIYYLQMILGNLLLQIFVHLKELPIVQWGKGHDTQTIIFPIAFTKQAFCCIVTPIGGGQGSDRVYSLSVKSFQILCGTNNDGLWLALGI